MSSAPNRGSGSKSAAAASSSFDDDDDDLFAGLDDDIEDSRTSRQSRERAREEPRQQRWAPKQGRERAREEPRPNSGSSGHHKQNRERPREEPKSELDDLLAEFDEVTTSGGGGGAGGNSSSSSSYSGGGGGGGGSGGGGGGGGRGSHSSRALGLAEEKTSSRARASSGRGRVVLVGGSVFSVGLASRTARRVSEKLRCLRCDHVVSRFIGFRWSRGARYMDFRNDYEYETGDP